MSETIVVPDNGNNNNGWNSPLGFLAMGGNNNGFLGGGSGLGAGILGFLLGALINGNGNGNGLFGGGGNNAAAALGAQATANNNTDLLMNAITNQGERQHEAVQTLSTMLGQDFNLVNSAVQTIQTSLATIAANQGMNTMQVINSIQAGNTSLQNQLCQCCCDMRQLVTEQGYQGQIRTLEQTNALSNGINSVNENITANRAAQQLSDCQQTYALTDTMNRNFLALDNKLDAMESGRKDREITALTAKVAQLESQNFTTGVIGQAVAPINGALNALAREVDDIKCKLPETVNVPYPQLQVVNTAPYVSGGFYPNGYGYGWNGGFFGNGFGGNITF